MAETTAERHPAQPEAQPTSFVRFVRAQRIEHLVLLIAFTILAATGLPQKFAITPLGEAVLALWGGIESARRIHRIAAVVLLAESIFHILAVAYGIAVQRRPLAMAPVPEDLRHLWEDVQFYLGRRKRKAYYGRYSYAEKAEYLAVVWGTLIMAITGFMMWNPIATARSLPGEVIPAAKAAHGGEALLAVLAIILWHFYHVHVRHFNKSMFTGRLNREEMLEEHPAELAQIESGHSSVSLSPEATRRRQRVFFPVAAVTALVLGFGLYRFTTFEHTAIDTVPPAESAAIFVPITPTTAPTRTPTQAVTPGAAAADTWDDYFSGLFRNRCGTCHVTATLSGLSLDTYQAALKGGSHGPAIVPGDPDSSELVKIQSVGNHPGQLTIDELNRVIAWIKAGAPEK
jgi:cytochrome b subunit of formate dehydrogenase